jgi:arsenate reductase-like glutaredoxin family protein
MGAVEALELAKSVKSIVAAKGKSIVKIDLAKDKPSDDEITAALLGPTGNLRAPTMRVGKTLLVGYSEEAYREVFGE